jgi:hypothetical protein
MGANPLFQFSFDVFGSLRTDFPDFNNGADCDPSYQGGGNTSYLLLDFFVADTHQNAAKIIIQGDKITNAIGSLSANPPNPSRYVFNFLSTKHSLFHILNDLKPGERMKNISIVITPYDENDFAGFPITIMFDRFGNKIILNQFDIDAFHTYYTPKNVIINDFQLGSYVTNFYVTPDYQLVNNNIDISGFCNNNEYGVNFLINTMCGNTASNFQFSLFPYSNVPGAYSDFPICFKDKENKNFGTMYANDPSIRLVTEVSTKATPVAPKQNYFKLVNLPNALILKQDNMGLDTLMKMNTLAFKNVVAIPKTSGKSSNSIFLLKKNKNKKK